MCAKQKMDPTESAETVHTFKLCPTCSFFCNTNEPDTFCSSCGSELIGGCPKCGKEIINPYAKYCKYCGSAYPGRTLNPDQKEF